ncbi:hypothetical protein EYF80_012261 [Liparis tanakae]|uniref:Uncharacterized protein n=1 Tax=Liparis tanakae TaxID=230148 RepID=A0A4Z2II49_9TELE|nr:hypothetical protein EYF80_012261 [Liparis tanakae]
MTTGVDALGELDRPSCFIAVRLAKTCCPLDHDSILNQDRPGVEMLISAQTEYLHGVQTLVVV